MSDPRRGESDGQRTDEARASLGMRGSHVVPAVVTRLVGLEPSWVMVKGEHYRTPSGRLSKAEAQSGLWVIARTAQDMALAVDDLLRIVEPRAESIKQAAKDAGATVSVGLWWAPELGQGGFTLPSSAFARLSALAERIDVYFPG